MSKNLTVEEKKQWILENCIDKNGDIDLSDLDFSDFGGCILIRKIKAKGDLFQNCQEVKGNLWQDYQTVQSNLFQDCQEVKGNLFQDYQEVGDCLYQNNQTVKNYVYQHRIEAKNVIQDKIGE